MNVYYVHTISHPVVFNYTLVCDVNSVLFRPHRYELGILNYSQGPLKRFIGFIGNCYVVQTNQISRNVCLSTVLFLNGGLMWISRKESFCEILIAYLLDSCHNSAEAYINCLTMYTCFNNSGSNDLSSL